MNRYVGDEHRQPLADEPGNGLAEILESFLVGMVRLVNARAGVIRSLQPDDSRMRVIAMAGLPDSVRRRESTAGSCGVCADAAQCAELRITSSHESCRELSSSELFATQSGGTVAVPLNYKGRTVGVFTLFFEGVNQLGEDVLHLLPPIGQLLGVTLENAKLEHNKLRASLVQERQTMASDIHDSLAQSLMFARLRMPLLQDAIAEKETAKALKYFRDVYEELGNANRRLRALITHFRAGMDAQGLMHALEETTVGFFERTGVKLSFENRAPQLRLPVEMEVQVFYIVQEALANVQRHSQARHARVIIEHLGSQAAFTVEDDGIGWHEDSGDEDDSGDDSGDEHFGLTIMRERAQSFGGRIEIARSRLGGASLCLFVEAADAAEPQASRKRA